MGPMIRSTCVFVALAGTAIACARHAPVIAPAQPAPYRMHTGPNSTPLAAGTRLAFQFNNEPMIVQVADGRGGPPILYHGKEINPNDLKSIVVLKGKEARDRFGDQTLDGAILIEFK